ncbi:uncharacterized protein A1O9_02215 [Exophiala aquamarina CBS 119918]|uniref:MARVEL domain-containing protein n=1 Tax=Exophiala aquamarina CBS 119918 TaxID=1182545 RepID=A0A072PKL8_9EURO|nr:uncharacterized protein A1O9_02215 [Exophiala aquamarina CBS 119918]KEF60654.1 hypothetical protein A1O9_02215 [Exophiala aquamarina CBS 119918]
MKPARVRNLVNRKGALWARAKSQAKIWKGTTIFHFILRLLQLVAGLVVVGMYGKYLNRAVKVDVYADGKWVYAVVVGSVAAASAITFMCAAGFLHFGTVAVCFAWDWVLVILFAALTGIFGSMYMPERVEMDEDIQYMKIAVIFDLINLGLWFASAVWSTFAFCRARKFQIYGRKKAGGERRVARAPSATS